MGFRQVCVCVCANETRLNLDSAHSSVLNRLSSTWTDSGASPKPTVRFASSTKRWACGHSLFGCQMGSGWWTLFETPCRPSWPQLPSPPHFRGREAIDLMQSHRASESLYPPNLCPPVHTHLRNLSACPACPGVHPPVGGVCSMQLPASGCVVPEVPGALEPQKPQRLNALKTPPYPPSPPGVKHWLCMYVGSAPRFVDGIAFVECLPLNGL